MEPSGGVDNNHIHLSGPGGLDAVVDHGGRVGSLVLADNGRAAAACPDFQLVGCRRPEGIRRHQQHPLSLPGQLGGDLADGGGFAHAVDPDDQHHAGGGAQIKRRVPHVQHVHQDFLQGCLGLLGLLQMPLPNRLAQPLHSFRRRVHAQVGQNQALLQFVVKVLVQLGIAGKDASQGVAEGIPGFGKSCLDFIKKSHTFSPYSTIPRYCSIWFKSSRSSFDTPCSCMVTP